MNFSRDNCSLPLLNHEECNNRLKLESLYNDGTVFQSNEEDISKDSEIHCVFCCKSFDSIDKVEIHIAQEHTVEESQENDFLMNNSTKEVKVESLMTVDKVDFDLTTISENKINWNSKNINNHLALSVYDVDLNLVPVDGTKLDRIKFCVRCNTHFDGEENLRQHQLKDHAIRKRKRSSHPNGVEGIVVTGDGRWSCDVCGREFPTLKQAKVHKFKSHIEPIQKQEMLSHDFMVRNSSLKELEIEPFHLGNENSGIPNNNENGILQEVSPVSNETGNQGSSNSELNSQRITTCESESENNSMVVDLSPVSGSINGNNADYETIWKIKSLDPKDTKISLSKIQLKAEAKENNTNVPDPCNLSIRQYTCSHCPASFSTRAVYSRHILVHRRGKAFGCDKCGMAFTRNHTLKQHKDMKCVISNPIVGVNCQVSDQCMKCGLYFASSNSHLSHCKKVCKISVIQNNVEEDSSKESVLSEETNAQYEGQQDIDLGENENLPIIINDFINNPAFVKKRINEFNCNLCCCYFASHKSIGHHLEHYHRIELRQNTTLKKPVENENLIFVQDFVHMCDECDLKYGSKEALMIHKQQTHTSKAVGEINNNNNNAEILNKYPIEKLNKIEIQKNPIKLNPKNFSQNSIQVFSSEALNLLVNQPVPSNTISVVQKTPINFKTNFIKKCKVPPNANGEFECTECHKAFGCRSSLSNHIKSHFNLRNKPFPCEDCKQGFMSQISYQEHRKSQCPKLYGMQALETNILSNFSNVAASTPSSASSRATCCMHCNSSFPDRSLLEDHAAKEHSNESGEVICIMCTRSFTTYMAFRVHMTKSHGGPNGTPLKNHLNSSTNTSSSQIKKVQSQSPITNSESTFSNFYLNYTFSPLIPHTCQTCKKDFSTAQALGNHKRACGSPIFSETNVIKDQLII